MLQKSIYHHNPHCWVEVIIPLALPKNYTWSVPESLIDRVRPGVRVEVVFGKNKKYAGIVKTVLKEAPEGYETKAILNVLDDDPVIYPAQLLLWEWMAQYYMCSEGEVMAAALPSHLKLSSETQLIYNEEAGDDFASLNHDEFLVAEALLIKKELQLAEVQQILDDAHVYPVIKKLIDKKVCFVWESLKDLYTPKKETYILLHPTYQSEAALELLLNDWARAPKQLNLLLSFLHFLKTEGDVTRSNLLRKSDATDAQLKGLIEKGILVVEKRVKDRLLYGPKDVSIDFELTAHQQQAFDGILLAHRSKSVCLLQGVTSSGKTLIYIKLIEAMIRTGKQTLYLLPEIALTAQIIRRLKQHFGGHIGIYHSKFSQNERVEIWNKVRSGELSVVLGARSALFLPFSDLGLIVVDEEHDASFKQQDPAPRYYARDAAIYYASVYNAKVVLGSATPSLETFFNAKNGKYGFAQLKERYGGIEMPKLRFIDLKKVYKETKQKPILSKELIDAIEQTIENGKQVILFQNRRGYFPTQVCQVCGWIPQCTYCDVALNYHKNTHKLHCHYCGAQYAPLHTCKACGNHDFKQKNFGTERIEEELETIFPKARIARMDVDSIRGKHAHDQLIRQLETQQVDILVGTQMVVKGLDFENVQLVGILDADSLWSFADYRVHERAFQLMEQVSGRAGRKGEQGTVIVQVMQTSHPVLTFVQMHDYEGFYTFELEGRKQFAYPPFSRYILITFKHKDREIVEAASKYFVDQFRTRAGNYVIGPVAPVVNRIRNKYLMECSLKLPRDTSILQHCKQSILTLIAEMHQNPSWRSMVVVPDVDAL